MPISLCNADAYAVEGKQNLCQYDCNCFFENGHKNDIITIYEKKQYVGCITYESFLSESKIENAIVYDKLYLEDNFWENAERIFSDNIEKRIPVFDYKKNMIYIAQYNAQLLNSWNKLFEIRNYVSSTFLKTFLKHKSGIHIQGINDVLWYLREWLIMNEVRVTVGRNDGWKFFGVEETDYIASDTYIIKEDGKWIDLLYAEYMKWLNDDIIKLKEVLSKCFIRETNKVEEKKAILFYLPEFFFFVDNIKPLIIQYLITGNNCVVVFPSIQRIISRGRDNIRKIIEIVHNIQEAGGICCSNDEKEIYEQKYLICYFCSEYSGRLPLHLKKLACRIVALQTTAIYTHMYRNNLYEGRFEDVFSEQAREEIDYLVTAEYTANWIEERDSRWSTKLLRFGYPKLDTLYNQLKEEMVIPDDWKQKILGNKVILITTKKIKQSWLRMLSQKKNIVIIWRPHPFRMAKTENMEEIEKICSSTKSLILDTMPSYCLAYKVSDAHIADPLSSVTVNYLYVNKPLCIFEDGAYKQGIVDYREEPWYKSAYIAENDEEIDDFISKVELDFKLQNSDQEKYREEIVKNFDGKVCKRIVQFFKDDVNF